MLAGLLVDKTRHLPNLTLKKTKTMECDDCAEEVPRRKRFWHCGMFVCPYCWHHTHCCEPNHSKEECKDLRDIKKLETSKGKEAVRKYLDLLREEELSAQ